MPKPFFVTYEEAMMADMKLSKVIPERAARTKTVEFREAVYNFAKYDESWRSIHCKSKQRHDHCDWCGHKFYDGEWFGLAIPMPKQEGPRRNWVLCNQCAESMGAADYNEIRNRKQGGEQCLKS